MSKEEKIYVGSGKKAVNYDIVNITICLDDKLKEHIYDYKEKKYINLTVAAKKETDQRGKTHYVAINTFKPDESKQQNETQSNDNQDDDLPF